IKMSIAGLYNMAGGESHKFKEGDDIDRFVERMKSLIHTGNVPAGRQVSCLKLNVTDQIRENIDEFERTFANANAGNMPNINQIYAHLLQTYRLSENEKKTRHNLLAGLRQTEFQTVDNYYNQFIELRRKTFDIPPYIAQQYFTTGLREDIR